MPSQDTAETLVLDTAPLLTAPLASVLPLAQRFVTTSDVLNEVRGKGQRERLEREWGTVQAQLVGQGQGQTDSCTAQHDGTSSTWQGLKVKEPSPEAIAQVTLFARQTGDLTVLSSTDIRVVALAYDVEVEANGTWRLRDKVGGQRRGKDPEKKMARLARKAAQVQPFKSSVPCNEGVDQPDKSCSESRNIFVTDDTPAVEPSDPSKPQDEPPSSSNDKEHSDSKADASQPVPDGTDVSCQEPRDHVTCNPDTRGVDSSHSLATPQTPTYAVDVTKPFMVSEVVDADDASYLDGVYDDESTADWSHVPIRSRPSAASDSSSSSGSFVSDNDPSWITPDNLQLHQARDLGGAFVGVPLHPKTDTANIAKSVLDAGPTDPQPQSAADSNDSGGCGKKKPTMKAALLTGDFAMQNVALQMGLNVLGVGGKRIRDVKTWVLRCYGCFKLCKDPTKKFCPSCGGTTLTRVSITYTPSSPTGFVLHLKENFQYRNRGTVYSIPSAKPGSASFAKGAAARAQKGVDGAKLVLREDQKEFQRGVKSAQVLKQKEERRAARGDASGAWDDPDWEPDMFKGDKGRQGGRGARGAASTPLGRDGLPVIGFGRNPNERRRR